MDRPERRLRMQRSIQEEMIRLGKANDLINKTPFEPGKLDEAEHLGRVLHANEIRIKRLEAEYERLEVPQPTVYLLHGAMGKALYCSIEDMEELDARSPLPEYEPYSGAYDLGWYSEQSVNHRDELRQLIGRLKYGYEFEAIRDITEEYEDAIKRSLTPIQRERRTKDLDAIMNCL